MTTRLAFFSDVHADVGALRDALVQMERFGCDLVVCGGDLIDCGLFPEETIEVLARRRIPCIRGNHDRWAVARSRGARFDLTEDPPEASRAAVSPIALDFLANLPACWDAVLEGIRVAVRHGVPGSDSDGIYPDQAGADEGHRWLSRAEADVLLVGHTHCAFAMTVIGGGLIANPGALLRDPAAKDGANRWLYDLATRAFVPDVALDGGTFGILELPSKTFTVRRAADGVEIEIPRPVAGVRDRRGR